MRREVVARMLPFGFLVMIVVLVFNSVLLARTAGYINFPGEISRVEIARNAGEMVVDYYEQQAAEAGVLSNSAVRDVLAQMKFEIDKASTPEAIVQLQTQYGQQVREVITREQENKRRDTVLSIISQDANVPEFKGETVIGISKSETDGVVVDDPLGVLSANTVEALKNDEVMKGSWPLIEVSIIDGSAQLVTARTMIDRLKIYEGEVDSLRLKLDEMKALAGYSEAAGPGVVVKLFDAEEGYSSVDIVHDRDVRDVVNELYAAGASAIVVGGQRLITTSSIRCAGPVILVNQQPIAVNPIVIEAVGDPDVLASSLDLIASQLSEFGIRTDITQKDQLVLAPFKEKK